MDINMMKTHYLTIICQKTKKIITAITLSKKSTSRMISVAYKQRMLEKRLRSAQS